MHHPLLPFVLVCLLGGAPAALALRADEGAAATFPIYPDSDTSYNPRVPCIAPVAKPGGGKYMEAEALFRYQLAPFVAFAPGGDLQAEIRDNGRREAKEIVALADGNDRLVLRVGKASEGRVPALVWIKNGKDAASAPLPKPLPRDWTKMEIHWDAANAGITLADGEAAKLALPAPFAPKNVSLQIAQVAALKIDGQGTFSLDWSDGYAAQVTSPAGNATQVRLFGFDTFVISRDETKRDCPMVQVNNSAPEAKTFTLACELTGEANASHLQWTQEIKVPAKSGVMTPITFPGALASDVYHLTVRSESLQPPYEAASHFLFVEDRDEPAGPAKFGLHDAGRNLFGCWPDALPVKLSTNYVSWGSVMGPPWVKDTGMTADTPADEWNWNRRVEWAIGQGLTTYVSLQSEPDYDWAREREYPPDHMRKLSFGTLGGFPKLDLYRKFVRAVALRYKGKVHMYEVENEPMAHAGIPPEDYVKIAQAVTDEIHAVDPEAKVFGICGTGDFIPWMTKVFALGGAKAMDGVSIHTYVTPNMPENAGLPAKLADVDKLIAGAGKPMPLLNSESGTYIALREDVNHAISPERLAELIKAGTPNLSVQAGWPFRAIDERSGGVSVVRNAIYNFLAGAEYFTFFGYNPTWPPADWARGSSLFSGEHRVDDACWAMISEDESGHRTPSLFTLSVGVLTEQLKGADALKGLPVNDSGMRGGVFPKADGGEVAVLWSPMGKRSSLLEAADSEIEVVSMLGKTTTLTSAAGAGTGRFRLEVGEEPVYVHAKHPGLHLLPSPVIAMAQDVSSPQTGFHFTVVNTSSQPWQGTIALAGPGGWKTTLDPQDFSLQPGGRMAIKGACEIPPGTHKGSYTVGASMKLPDGTPFEFPIAVDVRPSVTIPNVAPAFAWNDAASWTGVEPGLKIDQAEQVVVGRPPLLASLQEVQYWNGPKELSAQVRLASGPDALFVYVQARDANLKLPASWPGVGGSCVELFLDSRAPDAGLGHYSYGPGVYQLLVEPPAGAQHALRVWSASEKSGKLADVDAEGARMADGQYWMAIRIPWKSLNQPRTRDQAFGFDLGLDGARADGSGRKSQMMLFGTAADNTDASNFAVVRPALDPTGMGAAQ